MLAIIGNKVALYKFKISYIENDENIIRYCISEEEKNELEESLKDRNIDYSTSVVNQENNEWLSDISFNNRDEALFALNLGEQGYKEYNFKNDTELQFITMLLDVDFRLGLVEMGVMQ